MVDFAGWDMPIQYTNITDEHQAVRTGAGLFDISHMGRLSFDGPDTLSLLQHLFTNNAATMKDFQVRYGLVCNEQGGILDDVLVYRWPYGWADGGQRLEPLEDCPSGSPNRKPPGRQAIGRAGQVVEVDRNVQVMDQTLQTAMIAIQGPKAVELARGLTEGDASQLAYYYALPTRYRGKNCVVSRTGYTGEDGLEFMLPNDLAVTLWEELSRLRSQTVRAGGTRHPASGSRHAAVWPRTERGDRSLSSRARVGGQDGQGRFPGPRRPGKAPRRCGAAGARRPGVGQADRPRRSPGDARRQAHR